MNALDKEIFNVSISFDIQDHSVAAPVGWKKTSGNLVWDVKMDSTRKARWVKDGHRMLDPTCSNYARVVSRNSIIIELTYASLNDLEVTDALQDPSSDKH